MENLTEELIKVAAEDVAKLEKDDQNFRDGSKPELDALRELRDRAYKISQEIQENIDKIIQKENGWEVFVDKYVKINEAEGNTTYMFVNKIKRLYHGCRFVGNTISCICGDVTYRFEDEVDVDKSMIEVTTKEEYDKFVKTCISLISAGM